MVPGSYWLVNSFVVLDISKSLRQEVLKSEAIKAVLVRYWQKDLVDLKYSCVV
jgi:hypothetical protein